MEQTDEKAGLALETAADEAVESEQKPEKKVKRPEQVPTALDPKSILDGFEGLHKRLASIEKKLTPRERSTEGEAWTAKVWTWLNA